MSAIALSISAIISSENLTIAAQAATVVASEDEPTAVDLGEWKPGDPKTTLTGLIPAPANLPNLGRWQAMMVPIGSYVESAVFSPDGEQVVFGDGTYVRIHEAESLDLTGVMVGHTANVRAVGWSPDGKFIASGSDDATVRIWGADGVPIQILKGHSAPVRDVSWHPRSQLLASASEDGTIRFWNIDGTAGLVIDGHKAPVYSIAWSPDGQSLAAGDENQTIRLWNSDGKPGPVLSGHKGSISRVKWSPNGEWLASSSLGLAPSEPGQDPDATIRLWRKDGIVGPILRGHSREIRALT